MTPEQSAALAAIEAAVNTLRALLEDAPTPTYTLTATPGAADEGGAVDFTLTTTGVAAGTVLPYVLSGITAADLVQQQLAGSFTVGANGTASLKVRIAADQRTEGVETMTCTVGGGLAAASVSIRDTSVTPPPPPPNPGFAWAIEDGQTLRSDPGARTLIASGAAGLVTEVSPDLPPGRTLGVSAAGELAIAASSDAPHVNLSRTWVFEVRSGEMATAQNMRTGQMYGAGAAGFRARIQSAVEEAQDGDVIQISPGAIWAPGMGDGSGYLEGGMLHVYGSLTLTNVPGRGRWRLAPRDVPYVDGWSGLVVREPGQSPGATRKTIVIEGFDFSQWGRNADDLGIKIRANGAASSWEAYHASVTLRNFKLGKPAYQRSASGIAGAAENLTLEDGHVYDCGGGQNGVPGNDHNLYVTARNLVMRGVRSQRSRTNSADGTAEMDGHLAKLTFARADIQGCVFDCGDLGDSSIAVQCKGGGNLVFRGNFVRTGPRARTATGDIVFERERGNDGGWMFGLEGHSLLVERNVFVNHLAGARAFVYFRPQNSGNYLDQALISSCVIRDNVGMSTAAAALLVANAPRAYVGPWTAANAALPYDQAEAAFADRALLRYALRQPIAASGPSSTWRFTYPHGCEPRTDAFRGIA